MFSGRSIGRWWRKKNSAKVAGLVSGLMFGLCMAIFGFWKALVIAAFSFAGFILGVLIDGNSEIKSALGKLLGLYDEDDGEDE
jgi:uncharacterized membrane protein